MFTIFPTFHPCSSRPGTGKIWTVEGDEKLGDLEEGDGDLNSLSPSINSNGLSEEDQKLLMEKVVVSLP